MKKFDRVLDWFFPSKCVFCRRVLDNRDICHECAAKLPYTTGDSISQKFNHVKSCVSPLYYDGVVREAILRYKFWGLQVYAHRFGLIMSDCIENNLDCGDIDVISWVPLSRKRLRKRGYNQAQLLAETVSDKLDIPCVPTLKKIVDNPAQSGTKSSDARKKNVKGVYAYDSAIDLNGKSVLLIDDVVTTGATLSECAKTLKDAGAIYIYCATVARGRD
ncbi:MAG: ComF family protein [Bacillota bacterium]|nr:ComF family protein [Bacillota bacterium]